MPRERSEQLESRIRTFVVFFLVALSAGIVLEVSGVLKRAELQAIDRLFEIRPWLIWNSESRERLNPSKLLAYHDAHEMPRTWFNWDYTLSWLLERNHVPVRHKFILFNHLLEDEPPAEAAEAHPWMKPLMHYPTSRAVIASAVEFLARSGARLIILDNDFPQYSSDDDALARAISDSANGKFGRKVPVLMVRSVDHRSFGNVLQVSVPSGRSGIVDALSKLEPNEDILSKYFGSSSMVVDEDLIVRRCALHPAMSDASGTEALVLKAISSIGEPLPKNLSDILSIDFVSPPNSELYPVRPFSYLLDPAARQRMLSNSGKGGDVTVKDSIVVIGDGVTDLYPTPLTNLGVNLRSGPEILAQAIDTISRQSWYDTLSPAGCYFYIAATAFAAATFLFFWKLLCQRDWVVTGPLRRLSADVIGYAIIILGSLIGPAFLFAYARMVVPVVVPATALTLAAMFAALWEREDERMRRLTQRLEQLEQTMHLEQQQHALEMKAQEARAHAEQLVADQQRRREFVRTINHDLKAPITVMSWNLAGLTDLQLEKKIGDKVARIRRASDRMVGLLHELAVTYERGQPITVDDTNTVDAQNEAGELPALPGVLNQIVEDSVALARPIAEMRNCKIELETSGAQLFFNGKILDVSRVLDNLIRNAIIHNEPGTVISISLAEDGARNTITLSDNGCGIPEAVVHETFGVGAGHSRSEGRLGLSIVKGIIERLGGTIAVTSRSGAGTSFQISLPRPNSGNVEVPPVVRESEVAEPLSTQ